MIAINDNLGSVSRVFAVSSILAPSHVHWLRFTYLGSVSLIWVLCLLYSGSVSCILAPSNVSWLYLLYFALFYSFLGLSCLSGLCLTYLGFPTYIGPVLCVLAPSHVSGHCLLYLLSLSLSLSLSSGLYLTYLGSVLHIWTLSYVSWLCLTYLGSVSCTLAHSHLYGICLELNFSNDFLVLSTHHSQLLPESMCLFNLSFSLAGKMWYKVNFKTE